VHDARRADGSRCELLDLQASTLSLVLARWCELWRQGGREKVLAPVGPHLSAFLPVSTFCVQTRKVHEQSTEPTRFHS